MANPLTSMMHMMMDPTHMDHSNHSMPDHQMNHTGMQMYFVATSQVPHLLFEPLVITEAWQYALAIIICFILSVFNQFLVFLVKRKVTVPKKKDDEEFRDVDDHKRKARKRYLAYAWYIAKPIIYLLQNGLGYLLMLVTMTYNVGLFLAVIAGNTVGWTLFSMTSNIVPEDCCAN